MKKHCLALDIGGTFVKSGIIASDGTSFEQSVKLIRIDTLSAETIIDTFVKALKLGFEFSKAQGLDIAGIGISIAGPFDNERGISLMKHKLSAIYGLNLKNELIKQLSLPKDYVIRFEVDSWAFLRGEAWLGAAKGFERTIGITIGTGLGSGFMVGGHIVVGGPGIPKYGWLGGLPYEDGILDQRISRAGIIGRYREISSAGSGDLDVKDIALAAAKGDEPSMEVFKETGTKYIQILFC